MNRPTIQDRSRRQSSLGRLTDLISFPRPLTTVATSLAAAAIASAQVPSSPPGFTLPGSPPTKTSGGPPTEMPAGFAAPASTPADVDAVLRRGQASLDSGDIAGSIAAYRHAVHTMRAGKSHPTATPLAGRLVAMGIDATLLDLPPKAFQPLAPIGGSDVGAIAGSDGGVIPAVGVAAAGGNRPEFNPIQTMNGTADNAGGVAPVQFVDPPAGLDATAATDTASADASAAFTRGMELLSQGNKADARRAFLEAWKNEASLDPTRRDLLRDKLTLLQPQSRRLAPTTLSPSDRPAPASPLDAAQAARQEQTRRLYREVTSELAKIEQSRTDRPMEAEESLQKLLRRVDQSEIGDDARRALSSMVNKVIKTQGQYIEANRADIALELENESIKRAMRQEDAREAEIDQEVSTLVDEFNNLMKERRFEEANVIAKQVQLLKPDDPIAISMYHNSRVGTMKLMGEEVRDDKAEAFLVNMNDLESSAVMMNPNLPMQMPSANEWERISELRRGYDEDNSNLSPAEQRILRQLTATVEVHYRDRPLGEVLSDLGTMSGIPIILDESAMASVRVTPETAVSLDVDTSLELKSVLNILLDRLELAYVIRNDVMMITSMEVKRGDVRPRVYNVRDLVTPIPDFPTSYEDGLAGAMRAAYQMTRPTADVQLMPVSATGLNMANNGSPGTNPMAMGNMSGGGNVLGQYNPMGAVPGASPAGGMGGFGGRAAGGGAAFADFNSLIQLITTTIEPDTWEALGGQSTLIPYAQNLSLIISTTSDVHDQINDLLESLRRLQNLQITIEVAFITLSDQFAESIGVDFDLQFDDNLTQFPSDDAGPSVSVGFDGAGFTSDLDVRLDNDLSTTNPIGIGSTPSTLGFAILSDIEAFFFLQATQSDSRSNIMQAPKVTMFDGQLASIQDQTQRPFVTSIIPVVGDFAVAQQPVITVLNEGTALNVRGTVSEDKRFVRLTLVPFFSQIGDVDTFTFQGSSSSRRRSEDQTDTNGDGVVDGDDEIDTEDEEEIISGTTVQLPSFAFTTISTTVSVPDGGTILLGGIKRLNEARTEVGVPVLSKLPYINRLFRNQSIGRDARSLMMMVTPRIIIEEEEELAQTGYQTQR